MNGSTPAWSGRPSSSTAATTWILRDSTKSGSTCTRSGVPPGAACERSSRCMTFTTSLFILAAVASCGLGAVAVARPPRTLRRWSFALGMAGFATEALAAFALVTWSETPEDHVFWLKATFMAGLLLLVPGGFFVVSLVRPSKTQLSRHLWLGLGAGAVVAAGCAVSVALLP